MKEKTKRMNKESFLDTLEKEMKVKESYEIGTDEYARHTMEMTLQFNQYKILERQLTKLRVKTLINSRMKVE